MSGKLHLGRVGVWSALLRRAAPEDAARAAQQIEELGYPTAWVPSGRPGQLAQVGALLDGTETLKFGTSILNVYTEPDPRRVAGEFNELDGRHPGRLLLGVGVGHPEAVDRDQPGRYAPPLTAINAYLDGLDSAQPPVPLERRAIAALGPRMLEVAARRTAGALPYLTIPAHTRSARELMGPGALLAVELMVILEESPAAAREVARAKLAGYLAMGNYRNSFIRQGFATGDLEGGGSDRLVDEMVTWGTENRVRDRVAEHLAAGADHVAIQVLTADDSRFPVEAWKRLSEAVR